MLKEIRCSISARLNATTFQIINIVKKVNTIKVQLQHGALAHIEPRAIKGPTVTGVKQF